MSRKCVHKGCGKLFTDEDEQCIYHPGPPIFHEGQKGWKCCSKRVLTFDEFMSIPPCTTGRHSTVDDTVYVDKKQASAEEAEAKISVQEKTAQQPAIARTPIASQPVAPPATNVPVIEDDEDDPSATVPDGATCKRKTCGQVYKAGQGRDNEQCVHHPGQPLFHEGSKGWTCCKRRVLEFDEFMRIAGCHTLPRHVFVGKKQDADAEEKVETLRSDFYQTASSVIASLYMKKIDAAKSTIQFPTGGKSVVLDLVTSDRKRYQATMNLFGSIDVEASRYKVLGTKLELNLAKSDGTGWPVLRADDPRSGEIIQAGRAGRV